MEASLDEALPKLLEQDREGEVPSTNRGQGKSFPTSPRKFTHQGEGKKPVFAETAPDLSIVDIERDNPPTNRSLHFSVYADRKNEFMTKS